MPLNARFPIICRIPNNGGNGSNNRVLGSRWHSQTDGAGVIEEGC